MRTRLNERDLTRIVKRVLNEQQETLKPIPDEFTINQSTPINYFTELGGVLKVGNNEFRFKDNKNITWIVSKEWVWQQKGVDDQPKFLDDDGDGTISDEFKEIFNKRKTI